MSSLATKLPLAWRELCGDALPSLDALAAWLEQENQAGKTIYPPEEHWFAALQAVEPEAVRVVILGQDPYHGAGEAHGLAFSVQPGVRVPPSLLNIFKEIKRDLSGDMPPHGCLQQWAEQGVLLLNTVLTVEADRAGSHAKRGWEALTDCLVKQLAAHFSGIVFMLWGAPAGKKAALIDGERHCVLQSAHPSPLSVYRGFTGNGHFSAANRYLQEQGKQPINWQIN